MKLRIKKSSMIKSIMMLSLAISMGYLQLLPFEIAGNFTVPLFSIALSLLAVLIIHIEPQAAKREKINYSNSLKWYIILFTCILFANLLYTTFRYRYDFRDIIIALEPYMFVFFIFLTIYCLNNGRNNKGILWIISRLVTVLIIIKSVSWVLYYQCGILVFERLLFQHEGWIRDGYQRIETGSFFSCATAIALYNSFKAKHKWFYRILLIIFVAFVMIISRSRIQALFIVLALGLEVYFLIKSKRRIIYWILVGVAAVVLIASGFVSKFLNTFSTSNLNYTNSNSARYAAISYYVQKYWEEQPILGLGMLVSTNDAAKQYMTVGETTFFLDDLGILGSVVRFGFGGIILYIIPYIIYIKTCIKVRANTYGPIIIGTLVYSILYGIVGNIYDPQRAIETYVYFGLAIFFLNNKEDRHGLYSNNNRF